MQSASNPQEIVFGILIILSIIAFGWTMLKRASDAEEKEEREKKANAVEEREQEMFRLQQESRDLLKKLEARHIGDYFVAEPPAAEVDFFISHASEDKEAFVKGLAHELRLLGAKVFYDEFTLRVGDSL